jgi:F0F1-type ATP synthase assembly protein I
MASSNWKTAYRYGNVGLDLVLSIVVGFLLGRWVDNHLLNGAPWGKIVGTIIGVYAGFRSIHKAGQQMQRDADAHDRRDRAKAEKDAKVDAYKKEADSDEPKPKPDPS